MSPSSQITLSQPITRIHITVKMADAPQVAYAPTCPEVYQETPQAHRQVQPTEAHAYYYDPKQAPYADEHLPPPTPPTILGFRRRNFWILVVVAVVIAAATVGGSVGGSMAVRTKSEEIAQQAAPTSSSLSVSQSRSASASSTSASASAYIPPAATSIPLIDTSCPSLLRSWDNKQYTCTEYRNIQGGDITGISAYSIQQCIDACSTYNSVAGSTKCRAVAIGADLGHAYEINKGANCWLKESATPLTVNTKPAAIAVLVS